MKFSKKQIKEFRGGSFLPRFNSVADFLSEDERLLVIELPFDLDVFYDSLVEPEVLNRPWPDTGNEETENRWM